MQEKDRRALAAVHAGDLDPAAHVDLLPRRPEDRLLHDLVAVAARVGVVVRVRVRVAVRVLVGVAVPFVVPVAVVVIVPVIVIVVVPVSVSVIVIVVTHARSASQLAEPRILMPMPRRVKQLTPSRAPR
jgi:hypothetical protein